MAASSQSITLCRYWVKPGKEAEFRDLLSQQVDRSLSRRTACLSGALGVSCKSKLHVY